MCYLILSLLYWRSHSNSARKPKRTQQDFGNSLAVEKSHQKGLRIISFSIPWEKLEWLKKAMVFWKEIKKQINGLFMCLFACGSCRNGNLHKDFISYSLYKDWGCPWYKWCKIIISSTAFNGSGRPKHSSDVFSWTPHTLLSLWSTLISLQAPCAPQVLTPASCASYSSLRSTFLRHPHWKGKVQDLSLSGPVYLLLLPCFSSQPPYAPNRRARSIFLQMNPIRLHQCWEAFSGLLLIMGQSPGCLAGHTIWPLLTSAVSFPAS